MKGYKENDDIEEFTGFIPRYIPDSIQKVVYSQIGIKDNIILLCAKYYTASKSVVSLRNKEEKKIEKNEIKEENENIEKEKQEETEIKEKL